MAAGVAAFEANVQAQHFLRSDTVPGAPYFDEHTWELIVQSLVASDPAFRQVAKTAHPTVSVSFGCDLNRHVAMVISASYFYATCARMLDIPVERRLSCITFKPHGVFSVMQTARDCCAEHGDLRATATTAMLAPYSEAPLSWNVQVGADMVAAVRLLLPDEVLWSLRLEATRADGRRADPDWVAFALDMAAPLSDGRSIEAALAVLTPPAAPIRTAALEHQWMPTDRLTTYNVAVAIAKEVETFGMVEADLRKRRAVAIQGAVRLGQYFEGHVATITVGMSTLWERERGSKRALGVNAGAAEVLLRGGASALCASSFDGAVQKLFAQAREELADFYAPSPRGSPRGGNAMATPPSVASTPMLMDDVHIPSTMQVAPGRAMVVPAPLFRGSFSARPTL